MTNKSFDYGQFIDVPSINDTLWNIGYFCACFSEKTGIMSKLLLDLGFTGEEMFSGRNQERVHPHDIETYKALWGRVNSGQDDEFYCEYRVSGSDKRWHWIQTLASVIERNDDNSVNKIIGTNKEITSRKYAESYVRRELMDTKRKLDLSESIRLMGNFNISRLALIENHESGLEQLRQIIGFDYCQILSNSERNQDTRNELLISYPESRVELTDREFLLNKLCVSHYPVIHDNPETCAPYSSLLAVPLRFSGRFIGAVLLWHEKENFYRGQDLYAVRAFADILAVEVRNSREFSQNSHDQETDQLTGFHTKNSFLRNARELCIMAKEKEQTAAVAKIDIDKFRMVNENYGHAVGDRVLGKLSELFRMNLRSNSLIGRYGGEEFVIIVPDCSELDSQAVFERIRRTFEEMEFDGVDAKVTMSIGVTWGTGHSELEDTLDWAEKALSKAKSEGTNRLAFIPYSSAV